MNSKLNLIIGGICIIIFLLVSINKNTAKEDKSYSDLYANLALADVQEKMFDDNEQIIKGDNGFIISSRYACVIDTAYRETVWFEKTYCDNWECHGIIEADRILSLLKCFAPLAKRYDEINPNKSITSKAINTNGLKCPHFDNFQLEIMSPKYEVSSGSNRGYLAFANHYIFYIDEIDNAIATLEKIIKLKENIKTV